MPDTPAIWLAEFTANLTTTGAQTNPRVTHLANGNILVVWDDFSGPTLDVIGQMFTPLGERIGAALTINAGSNSNDIQNADVAALDSGGFVTVYEDFSIGGNTTSIRLTLRDAAGLNPVNVTIANDTTSGFDPEVDPTFGAPRVAVSSGTSVLVVYREDEPGGTDSRIVGNIYNPETGAVGSQFSLINFAGTNVAPTVTVLGNGNYVIAAATVETNGNQVITYRIISATGSNVLGSTRVADTNGDSHFDRDPSVTALTGGGFVITWTNTDANDTDIEARLFDAAGGPQGNLITVPLGGSTDNANESAVVALADGGFIVLWDDDVGGGALRGQRYNAAGAQVGVEFTLATGGVGNDEIDAELLADGRVAVSFERADGEIGMTILDTRDVANTPNVYAPLPWHIGTIGDDTITADSTAYTVAGWDGDDILNTSRVELTAYLGGNGNDTVNVFTAIVDDTYDGGAGTDTIDWSGSGQIGGTFNLATGFVGDGVNAEEMTGFENLIATGGDDTIIGTVENNVLTAGFGDDSLTGGDGNDALNGGGNADTLDGGIGNDTVNGDDDDDRVFGGDGNDTLFGGLGGDTLSGGSGNDNLDGGDGNDTLNGSLGTDALFGGAGNDNFGTITAAVGFDDINGGADIDRVSFAAETANLIIDLGAAFYSTGVGSSQITGVEDVTGGSGRDLIVAAAGTTRIDAGVGNDTVTLTTLVTTALGGTGTDTLQLQLIGSNVTINLGTSVIHSGFENLVLGGGNDTATGTGGANSLRGGAGSDTLSGLGGADVLSGDGNDDTLDGGDDADTLFGGSGADRMLGGAGNDNLQGDAGIDLLIGNAGTDRLDGGADDDTLLGGVGTDSLTGGAGNDVFLIQGGDLANMADASGTQDVAVFAGFTGPTGLAINLATGRMGALATPTSHVMTGMENALGSHRSDSITGSTAANSLSGLDGDDTLAGGDGADRLDGNGGNDTLRGDAGNDSLDGADGNDTLDGGSGIDSLAGQDGDDNLTGGDNDDRLSGDGGNDVLFSGFGNDTATGGADFDQIFGGDGTDSLDGGTGNDRMFGGAGNDRLTGGDGDDFIFGDTGNDILDGGVGNDRLFIFGAEGPDNMIGGVGTDTLDLSGVTGDGYFVDGKALVFHDGIAGPTAFSGIELAIGTGQDDSFLTDNLNITFQGGVGFDMLDLSLITVNTVLNMGTGSANAVTGLFLGFEQAVMGSGNDTVAGTDGDNRILGLAGNDNLSGLLGNDSLFGGDGGDTLNGGAGNDTLAGGAGNDTFAVDSLTDTISEDAGGGNRDRVLSTVTYALAADDNIERIAAAPGNGTGDIDLTGNALHQRITGNRGDNRLDGGGGRDLMIGGAGNDTYVTDGGDRFKEKANGGTDTVESSATHTLRRNVDNLVVTGEAAINGTGNTAANRLTGNGADNALNGRGGADRLTGGAGEDSFVFNAGLSGGNIDRITDFSRVDDLVRLEGAIFTGIGNGSVSLAEFKANRSGNATDATDRIIYETDTGKLFYDIDGDGAADKVQFAVLDARLGITEADFLVF